MSVFGGQQFRPLLHVRDVATASVPHIESDSTGIFNLCTENVTIIELARRIQLEEPGSKIVETEMSFQDARNYRVASDLARGMLGFAPKWSVEDGIREVAQVVRSRRIPDVTLPRFSNVAALRGRI
jgi:nucleoside-diphosphate-sugar epimerase